MARSVQEIQEELAIVEAQTNALIAKYQTDQAALNLPKSVSDMTPVQQAAFNSSNEEFRKQRRELLNKKDALSTEFNQTTAENPANSTYNGPDPSSGLPSYTNSVTGKVYVSKTAPSNAQQQSYEATQIPAQKPPQIISENKTVTSTPVNVSPASTDNPSNIGQNGKMPIIGDKITASTAEEAIAKAEESARARAILETGQAGSSFTATVDVRIEKPEDENGKNGVYTAVATVLPSDETQTTNTIDEPQAVDYSYPYLSDDTAAAGAPTNTSGAELVAAPNASVLAAIGAGRQSGPTSSTKTPSPPKEQKVENDWRFRLQLARQADYLYNISELGDVLHPLRVTNGIIFPYMPTVSMSYSANYDAVNIPHTNYKHFQYQSSEVSPITLTADFTAQDTSEANYLLAVIHFFRSITKMFYGKDSNPPNGVPPPLCFLSGLGQYQFDMHPVQVAGFNYNLPNDVDYIRANAQTLYTVNGVSPNTYDKKPVNYIPGITRKENNNLPNGAVKAPPKFTSLSNNDVTYVPTKLQMTLVLNPVVTRNDISNNFSLRDYANGTFYHSKSKNNKNGGGIW